MLCSIHGGLWPCIWETAPLASALLAGKLLVSTLFPSPPPAHSSLSFNHLFFDPSIDLSLSTYSYFQFSVRSPAGTFLFPFYPSFSFILFILLSFYSLFLYLIFLLTLRRSSPHSSRHLREQWSRTGHWQAPHRRLQLHRQLRSGGDLDKVNFIVFFDFFNSF